MGYKIKLGPQPTAYVRDVLDSIFPGAKRFFEYIVSSLEEGTTNLEIRCVPVDSMKRRVQTTPPDELELTKEQAQLIVNDLTRTIRNVPEACMLEIEARPPGAPRLYYILCFEQLPPPPDESCPEVTVFKLSLHLL